MSVNFLFHFIKLIENPTNKKTTQGNFRVRTELLKVSDLCYTLLKYILMTLNMLSKQNVYKQGNYLPDN